jgi:hypothetical protein
VSALTPVMVCRWKSLDSTGELAAIDPSPQPSPNGRGSQFWPPQRQRFFVGRLLCQDEDVARNRIGMNAEAWRDRLFISPALGSKAPDPARYRSILNRAADRLSAYAAARVALSTSRLPIKPLRNKWGKPRGGDKHPFPESLEKSSCRKYLRKFVRECGQDVVPTEKEVVGGADREFEAIFDHVD